MDIPYLKDKLGLSWPEVAERSGLTPEAARSRYRRLKAKNDRSYPNSDYVVTEAQITGIEPEISGVGPDDNEIDPSLLWQAAFNAQSRVAEHLRKKRLAQKIVLPTPCALAFLSDLHFGSPFCDYQAAQKDAQIIQSTPNMFAEFHGDGVDNWIVGKLTTEQRGQAVNFDAEWHLFFDWLKMLSGKLVAVVPGNHENWSIKLAGIDRVREALRGTKILYDPNQIVFDLVVGHRSYRVKLRHKWKYNSIFNATHSIEVGWERGGNEFDIGVGGHTHIATLCRPFIRNGEMKYAVLTGTYKMHDSYGESLGYAPSHGKGAGAFVFDHDGSAVWLEDLERAADYLSYLRSRR